MSESTWYKPRWRDILRASGFACLCYTFGFGLVINFFGWNFIWGFPLMLLVMHYTLFVSICLMARKGVK